MTLETTYKENETLDFCKNFNSIENITDEKSLLAFSVNNSIDDMFIADYSFFYDGKIFVFEYKKLNADSSLFYGNFFFKEINESEGLYLLLDSKFVDSDDCPDPGTSIVLYFQPKVPFDGKIVKLEKEFISNNLNLIREGSFSRYTVRRWYLLPWGLKPQGFLRACQALPDGFV